MKRATTLQRMALASAVLGLSCAMGTAQAQTNQLYPKPDVTIKLVSPYAAGGGSDTLARLIAPKLAERLGSTVIVENRPGAGGTIGAGHVAKADPDGHTILFTITSLIQAPMLLPKVPYDAMADFLPVTLVARVPTGFVVRSDFPANTMAEFIKIVKTEPKKHSIGNYGAGTLSNIQAATLIQQTGIDAVQAAYQGAPPLMRGIISGDVAGAFTDIQSSIPQAASGRVKFLGVTGTERVSVLPDAPVLGGTYKHLDLYGWIGVFLPARTPAPIATRLAEALQGVLEQPEIREKLKSLAFVPGDMNRAQFAAMVKSDYVTWGQLIKSANIKID